MFVLVLMFFIALMITRCDNENGRAAFHRFQHRPSIHVIELRGNTFLLAEAKALAQIRCGRLVGPAQAEMKCFFCWCPCWTVVGLAHHSFW
jgi:hypothetical protein